MTESELAAEIKSGSPGGVYFLYGEEDYMKNYRVQEMKKKVAGSDPSLASLNCCELYFGVGELDTDAIETALLAPPLMADRRIVSLYFADLDSLKSKDKGESPVDSLFDMLSEYAGQDETVVVLRVVEDGFDAGSPKRPSPLLAKAEKLFRCVNFEYLSRPKLTKWLEKLFASYGLAVEAQAYNELFDLTGYSMYSLHGDASRTAAYAASHGGQIVTVDDVRACCTKHDNDDPFYLTDCLLSGNMKAALQYLKSRMLKNEDPILMLGKITSAFRDLSTASAFVRDGRTAADYANTMKINEYRARRIYTSASSRPPEYFAAAMSACLDADRRIKTGAGYAAIERLLCMKF